MPLRLDEAIEVAAYNQFTALLDTGVLAEREAATYYVRQYVSSSLDGDDEGVPCESLRQKVYQSQANILIAHRHSPYPHTSSAKMVHIRV